MPHIYELNPHLKHLMKTESTPKRARNSKGQLVADDPTTETNEAWEGGVAPKKRGRPKKKKQ